jgi:hypothetical protein
VSGTGNQDLVTDHKHTRTHHAKHSAEHAAQHKGPPTPIAASARVGHDAYHGLHQDAHTSYTSPRITRMPTHHAHTSCAHIRHADMRHVQLPPRREKNVKLRSEWR